MTRKSKGSICVPGSGPHQKSLSLRLHCELPRLQEHSIIWFECEMPQAHVFEHSVPGWGAVWGGCGVFRVCVGEVSLGFACAILRRVAGISRLLGVVGFGSWRLRCFWLGEQAVLQAPATRLSPNQRVNQSQSSFNLS